MAQRTNFRQAGERIEQLLGELRATSSPPALRQIEDCMSTVVDLYGEVLHRIVDIVSTPNLASGAVAARLLDDDMIASVLILHNLHPQGFRSRIATALERVRPYLGSHGGDIELLVADERSGTVRLRLAGSCDGCPSSLLTVKNAVEAAIMKVAPDVTCIEVQGMVDHPTAAANAAGGRQ